MYEIKYVFRVFNNPKLLSSLALFLAPLPLFPSFLAQVSFLFLSFLLLIIFTLNIRVKAHKMQFLRREITLEFIQFHKFKDCFTPETQQFFEFEKPINFDLDVLIKGHTKIYLCWLFFIHALHNVCLNPYLYKAKWEMFSAELFYVLFAVIFVMGIICFIVDCSMCQLKFDAIRYFERNLGFRKKDCDDVSILDVTPFFCTAIYMCIIYFVAPTIFIGSSFQELIIKSLIFLTFDLLLIIRFAYLAFFKKPPEYEYELLVDIYCQKERCKQLLTNEMATNILLNTPPPITPPTIVFNPNQGKPKRPY